MDLQKHTTKYASTDIEALESVLKTIPEAQMGEVLTALKKMSPDLAEAIEKEMGKSS